MSVRLPGLLLPNLTESRRLRPTAGSLTVKMVGSSEAVLTLPEDEADIQIHDWVSVYTEEGPAGLFRVTNVAQPLKKQVDVTLLHGIDILSDSVWAEQTEFSGTKEAFLRAMLNQQTQLINGQRPWVLGVCEDTATVRRGINYDRLSTLLEGLNEDGGDYWFTYDMTVFPWVLNYVHVDNTVVSEFRLTRNIRSATVTYNDADLCTRLFLTVSTKTEETVPTKKMNPAYVSDQATPNVPRIITENITVSSVDSRIKQYNNVSAQEDWGIVVKTADIDTTDDILNGHFESADAWAAAFMARRSAPSVQIQIDGDDLFALTGDVWDRTKVGRLCQVALPAYGKAFQERVVSVTYPELFKKPDEMPIPTHVIVSLSNILPRFSESLAQAEKEAASASRSSRSTARAQTKDEKELTTWSQHVQWQGAALDGSGIMTLYESGIDMDATGGVKIYSLENGLQGLYGELVVQAREIAGKVGSDALNGYLQITALSTEMGNVMEGANGETVAAKIVTAINDREGTGVVKIEADQVDITGLVTMTQLDARLVNVDDLFTTTGTAAQIKAGNINAGGNVNADGAVYGTGIYIKSGSGNSLTYLSMADAVSDIQKNTDAPAGEIGIKFRTLGNSTWHIVNFNIADTAYYQSHVGIDAANLTLTEIGSTPYDASDADEITGIEAGTSDKYYLLAATPNDGSTVYKKFTLPAASAPPVTASIDDLTGTGISANQILASGIPITASGTNVSAYSENATLESTTYQVGSITRHCVNLKLDNTVIGRINIEDVYTDGKADGMDLVTAALVSVSSVPSGSTATNLTSGGTYDLQLTKNGTVTGHTYYSVPAATTASIDDIAGTGISANQLKDTAIPITASGTNVSDRSENAALESTTYQVGSITRHCVNLKLDNTVIGRISIEDVYTAGKADGMDLVTAALVSVSSVPSGSTATNLTSGGTYDLQLTKNGTVTGHTYYSVPAATSASIDDIAGTGISANQILDSAIPITASGTNVSDRSENASLESTTYQVGSITRHCVNLKLDNTVIGRISIEDVYTDGRDSVTVTGISRVANCSYDPDEGTARQNVQVTLSNGNTATFEGNFDDVYQAGLRGEAIPSTVEFEAALSSGGAVFDYQDELYVDSFTDIYQQGVTDRTVETHTYIYEENGDLVPIYVYLTIGSQGTFYAVKDKKFYPNTIVEITSSQISATYIQVSYGGQTYYVHLGNLRTATTAPSESKYSRTGIYDANVTITSVTLDSMIHTGGCGDSISVYVDPDYGSAGTVTSYYMGSAGYNAYTVNGSVADYFDTMPGHPLYSGRHEATDYSSDITHKAFLTVTYSDGFEQTVIVEFDSYAKAESEVVYNYIGTVGGATGSVKMRQSASTSATVLASVPVGTTVRCLYDPNGYADEWMPIQYGDQTGYMMAKFIIGTDAYEAATAKVVSTVTLIGVGHAIGSSSSDFTVMVRPKNGRLTATTSAAIESSDYARNWAVTNRDPENYLMTVNGNYYLYHLKSAYSSNMLMRVKVKVTYTNSTLYPAETLVISATSKAQ